LRLMKIRFLIQIKSKMIIEESFLNFKGFINIIQIYYPSDSQLSYVVYRLLLRGIFFTA